MLHPTREDLKRLYFQEGSNFIATLFPGKEQQQDADAACAYIVQSLKTNQFRVCRFCFNAAANSDPPAPVRWSFDAETRSDGATLIVPPTSTALLQDIIDKSQREQFLQARLDTPCQHLDPAIIEKTAFELDGPGGVGVFVLNFLTEHDAESGKKVKLEEGKVSLVHPFTVSLKKINGAFFEVRVIGVLYRSSSRSHDNGHYITVVLLPDNTSRLFGNGLRIRDFTLKQTADILKQGFLPTKCETSSTADPTRLSPKGNKFLVRAIFTNSGPIPVDQTISDILQEPIPDEPEPESKSEPQIESVPGETLPNSLAPDSTECRRRCHSVRRLCPGGCFILTLLCSVCGDNGKDGSYCTNRHFTCSDCFAKHMKAQHNELNGHQIKCPLFPTALGGCDSKVSYEDAIMRVIHSDGRLGHPSLYAKFAIGRSESDSDPEPSNSIDPEGTDDPLSDPLSDHFETFLRLLMNKCPRCGQAWSTPENGECAAVTCAKTTCCINFCGYCSGEKHDHAKEVTQLEAHTHVKNCPFNCNKGLFHPPTTEDGKTDFALFEAICFQAKAVALCEWLLTLDYTDAIELVDRYSTTATASRAAVHYCLLPTLERIKEIQILDEYKNRAAWIGALRKSFEDFEQQVLSQQVVVREARLMRVIDQLVNYISFVFLRLLNLVKIQPPVVKFHLWRYVGVTTLLKRFNDTFLVGNGPPSGSCGPGNYTNL